MAKLFKDGKLFDFKNFGKKSKGSYNVGGGGYFAAGSKYTYPEKENVVKVIKPTGIYIPIKVTQVIYAPLDKISCGEKVITINVCHISSYCQSTIFGKSEIETVIFTPDDRYYVKESWKQLDNLIQEAITTYQKNHIMLKRIETLESQVSMLMGATLSKVEVK